MRRLTLTLVIGLALGFSVEAFDAAEKPACAQKKKRKRRRARKKTTPPPAPAEGAAAAAAPGASFRGPTRIDFDERLVQGQTNRSGAVVLFSRKQTGIRSMVKRRKSFRHLTIATIYDR